MAELYCGQSKRALKTTIIVEGEKKTILPLYVKCIEWRYILVHYDVCRMGRHNEAHEEGF